MPVLPPALVFGVQFISGILLLANLFVPLVTVLPANEPCSWKVSKPEVAAGCQFWSQLVGNSVRFAAV